MNNLVFGKYIPIDSIIHKLDPRIKIITLIVMLVAIFVPDSWYCYLALFIFEFIILILSKIRFKMILSAFKPMIFMVILLTVINCLTLRTGNVLFSIGSFSIYSDAIFNTLFIIVRLFLMIILTTILTATTKPLDLTLGIEYLLKPLTKIGFPSHEIAMMISIALRFIPIIIEETMRIMQSQKSRGVDFDEGKFSEKIKAILSLIIPLFSVAFERAYELADAMEARGYVPDKPRTRYRTLTFHYYDFIYLMFAVCLLAFSIWTKVAL